MTACPSARIISGGSSRRSALCSVIKDSFCPFVPLKWFPCGVCLLWLHGCRGRRWKARGFAPQAPDGKSPGSRPVPSRPVARLFPTEVKGRRSYQDRTSRAAEGSVTSCSPPAGGGALVQAGSKQVTRSLKKQVDLHRGWKSGPAARKRVTFQSAFCEASI